MADPAAPSRIAMMRGFSVNKILAVLSPFLLLLFGAGFGYALRSTIEGKPLPLDVIYQSRVNNAPTVSVTSDGKVEFGSHYDRVTEAKKLVDLARRMLQSGETPDCHETGYQDPGAGMLRVFPGPADAPPLRFEWRQ